MDEIFFNRQAVFVRQTYMNFHYFSLKTSFSILKKYKPQNFTPELGI